jgi:hypothetical protein
MGDKLIEYTGCCYMVKFYDPVVRAMLSSPFQHKAKNYIVTSDHKEGHTVLDGPLWFLEASCFIARNTSVAYVLSDEKAV